MVWNGLYSRVRDKLNYSKMQNPITVMFYAMTQQEILLGTFLYNKNFATVIGVNNYLLC